MSPTTKPGPKRTPVKCEMCGGRGTVPTRDERGRSIEVACRQCGGNGEG